MTANDVREFECVQCGHKVVVNPRLPKDYTPSVCTPCWENIVAPKMMRDTRALLNRAHDFLTEVGADPAWPKVDL